MSKDNLKNMSISDLELNLDNLELSFMFENSIITVLQLNYGIFTENFTAHRHSKNFFEFHLVCQGEGTLISNGITYPLQKGVLYTTGPDITHEQLTNPDNNMHEYCIGLSIKHSKSKPLTYTEEMLFNNPMWVGADSDDTMLSLFKNLEAESTRCYIGYETIMKNIISTLITYMVRYYTDYAKSPMHNLSIPDNRRVLTIDNMFLTNYHNITEEMLSSKLNLSTRQLQRFLSKQYGKTFIQMRTEARMNKAQQLRSKGISLSDIAYMVGYSNETHFRKLYKKFNK